MWRVITDPEGFTGLRSLGVDWSDDDDNDDDDEEEEDEEDEEEEEDEEDEDKMMMIMGSCGMWSGISGW